MSSHFPKMTEKERRDAAIRRHEDRLAKEGDMSVRMKIEQDTLKRLNAPSPVLLTKKPSEEG